MKPKINFENILSYIEGNYKKFLYILRHMPIHVQEQVAYRLDACKEDCVKSGFCVYCGCDIDGKVFVKASCNKGERFPDLMEADEWELNKEKLVNGDKT
jgi:hypothetical protein